MNKPSNNIASEIRNYSNISIDEKIEKTINDKRFPLSLKKLQNKPYLTPSEEIMVKLQLCHGKGKRKRHKKKK